MSAALDALIFFMLLLDDDVAALEVGDRCGVEVSHRGCEPLDSHLLVALVAVHEWVLVFVPAGWAHEVGFLRACLSIAVLEQFREDSVLLADVRMVYAFQDW